jgi:hypothetical protein
VGGGGVGGCEATSHNKQLFSDLLTYGLGFNLVPNKP